MQQEQEEQRKKEEEERLEAEERSRLAKRPRHDKLDLPTLAAETEPADIASLRGTLEVLLQKKYPKRVSEVDTFVFEEDSKKAEREVAELSSKLKNLKVVARAKVTQDRVYSMAYHPEPTKDLIFFGGKLYWNRTSHLSINRLSIR